MYLYFIQARSYVKIGYASDPVDRMNELQVGNPIPMQIVAVVRCNSQGHAQAFERAIHSIVRRYSIRGEWFEYGPIAWAISRLSQDIQNAVESWFESEDASIEEVPEREPDSDWTLGLTR